MSNDQVDNKLASCTVLMVEDDSFFSDIISTKLLQHNCLFSLVESCSSALSSIREERPQIILLDIMLPDGSGFDILRQVKTDEELKHIPVIVFSNNDSTEDFETAQSLGADAYLIKSQTEFDVLLAKMNELLPFA